MGMIYVCMYGVDLCKVYHQLPQQSKGRARWEQSSGIVWARKSAMCNLRSVLANPQAKVRSGSSYIYNIYNIIYILFYILYICMQTRLLLMSLTRIDNADTIPSCSQPTCNLE